MKKQKTLLTVDDAKATSLGPSFLGNRSSDCPEAIGDAKNYLVLLLQAFFEENSIKVHIPEGKDIDITPLAGFQFDGFAKRLVK